MPITLSQLRKLLATLLIGIVTFYSHAAASDELIFQSGQKQNTLIELYTSQGCSSCPPAERWLGSLQKDHRLWKTLIPVAFHVDYWDYIGWKDHLAKSAFSQRQRQYRREHSISSVYTPGFIVNGKEWRRWLGLSKLPVSESVAGILTVSLNGDEIQASYKPNRPVEGSLRLNLAIIGVGISTKVTRGENAGKVLPQDFSVLALKQQDSNDGQWHMTLPDYDPVNSSQLAIAAWVSPSDTLAPLQAVGGWLRRQ